MSAGRKFLLILAGPLIGGVTGLLGGLGWTELAATTGFEGYSRFVVVYWIAAGTLLGLAAGVYATVRG